jgi:hypothetical protein
VGALRPRAALSNLVARLLQAVSPRSVSSAAASSKRSLST